MPVADMFWGDRYGKLEDPFGHQWSVGDAHARRDARGNAEGDGEHAKGGWLMARKITSMLWFDSQAEQAARFYVSVFKGGKLGKPMYEPGGKKVLVMPFELQGQEFSALNGGPQFKFSESVSFVIALQGPEGGRLLLGQAAPPTAARNRCAAG